MVFMHGNSRGELGKVSMTGNMDPWEWLPGGAMGRACAGRACGRLPWAAGCGAVGRVCREGLQKERLWRKVQGGTAEREGLGGCQGLGERVWGGAAERGFWG